MQIRDAVEELFFVRVCIVVDPSLDDHFPQIGLIQNLFIPVADELVDFFPFIFFEEKNGLFFGEVEVGVRG